MAKGYRTKYGLNLKLQCLGLIEHDSCEYQPSTFENAKNGDGIIWFAYNFDSVGEKMYFDRDHSSKIFTIVRRTL